MWRILGELLPEERTVDFWPHSQCDAFDINVEPPCFARLPLTPSPSAASRGLNHAGWCLVLIGVLSASLCPNWDGRYALMNDWDTAQRIQRSRFPELDSDAAVGWALQDPPNPGGHQRRPFCRPETGESSSTSNQRGHPHPHRRQMPSTQHQHGVTTAGTVTIVHGGFVSAYANREHADAFDLVYDVLDT